MRLRIRFTKLGKVRFVSHRDVARIWERALRKSGVPVAVTTGFTPRPRVAFGLALATGAESLAEYLDVDLAGDPGDLGDLGVRLTGALPPGMDVTGTGVIDRHTPSLQQDVCACSWRIELPGLEPDRARAVVEAACAATELPGPRTRQGRVELDDLRPGIVTLAAEARPEGVTLVADLSTRPRAVRPSDLVAALFPGQGGHRVLRTHQWIERDGLLREPLEATSAHGEPLGVRP